MCSAVWRLEWNVNSISVKSYGEIYSSCRDCDIFHEPCLRYCDSAVVCQLPFGELASHRFSRWLSLRKGAAVQFFDLAAPAGRRLHRDDARVDGARAAKASSVRPPPVVDLTPPLPGGACGNRAAVRGAAARVDWRTPTVSRGSLSNPRTKSLAPLDASAVLRPRLSISSRPR